MDTWNKSETGENRHQASDLIQMQKLPLRSKIEMTKQRIRQWYEHWDGQVYVSFSGGKDSTVLKHIVDSMYDDVPAVFVNTGLEYPEIQHFVKAVKNGKWSCFNQNVEILYPEMRFDEVILKYGYPVISKEISERIYYAKNGADWAIKCMSGMNPDGSKSAFKQSNKKYEFLVNCPVPISHKCCSIMKKNPAKQYEKATCQKPILGTMACESRLRTTQWIKIGCNAFESKRPRSAPLSFWTEQDVLHYLKEYNVPYCPIYGEIQAKSKAKTAIGGYEPKDQLQTSGANRTGCIFCMYGAQLEKEPNRFQRLKETHPSQYRYCIGGVK